MAENNTLTMMGTKEYTSEIIKEDELYKIIYLLIQQQTKNIDSITNIKIETDKISHIIERIDGIDKLLHYGNGKPSIIVSLSTMNQNIQQIYETFTKLQISQEQHERNDIETLDKIYNKIDKIYDKLESKIEKKEAKEEEEIDKTQDKKTSKWFQYVGWILSVLLTLITLIPYLIEKIIGK